MFPPGSRFLLVPGPPPLFAAPGRAASGSPRPRPLRCGPWPPRIPPHVAGPRWLALGGPDGPGKSLAAAAASASSHGSFSQQPRQLSFSQPQPELLSAKLLSPSLGQPQLLSASFSQPACFSQPASLTQPASSQGPFGWARLPRPPPFAGDRSRCSAGAARAGLQLRPRHWDHRA